MDVAASSLKLGYPDEYARKKRYEPNCRWAREPTTSFSRKLQRRTRLQNKLKPNWACSYQTVKSDAISQKMIERFSWKWRINQKSSGKVQPRRFWCFYFKFYWQLARSEIYLIKSIIQYEEQSRKNMGIRNIQSFPAQLQNIRIKLKALFVAGTYQN